MRNSIKVTRTSIITMLVCASIGLSWQFVSTSAQEDGKKPSTTATTTADDKEAFFKQIDEISKLQKFTDDEFSKILNMQVKFFGHGLEPFRSRPEDKTSTVDSVKVAHNKDGKPLLIEIYVPDKLTITEDDIVKRYGPGKVTPEHACESYLENESRKTQTTHTYKKENKIVVSFDVIKKPQDRLYIAVIYRDDDDE